MRDFSSDDIDESTPKQKYRLRLKIIFTICLCFSWICLGLYSEILGTCLPRIVKNTNSDLQQLGESLSIRDFGYFSGSIIGGFLADRYPWMKCIFIGLSLILGGLTNLVIPFCNKVVYINLIFYIAGLSHGSMTTCDSFILILTAGNPLLNQVWLEKSSGPFNLMHAGYGLGSSIAPLLVSSFTPEADNLTLSQNVTGKNASNASILEPLAISTGFNTVCALFFFSLYIHSRYILKLKDQRQIEPGSKNIRQIMIKTKNTFKEWLSNSGIKNLIIVPLVIGIYFSLVGNERIFGKFMFTYAIKGPIQLTGEQGYLLNMLYWQAFFVGRIGVFILAFKIPIQYLYAIQLIGTFASSLGMCAAPYEPIYYFIFSTLFGLFKSPLFPTTLGVLTRVATVTGFITLFVNTGSAAGAVVMQSLTGYLLEKKGQFTFPYIVFVTSVVLMVCGLLFTLIVELQHRKTTVNVEDEPLRYENSENV